MHRRQFLHNLAATPAGYQLLSAAAQAQQAAAAARPDIEGHTLVCEFTSGGVAWKVYEDLRTRDGAVTFVSARGARVLAKSAEAAFPDGNAPHLGLKLEDIGASGPDLLADKLLASGDDPDPRAVMSAAPPQGSAQPSSGVTRTRWDTFVGTKEAYDTMMVYPGGNTRTYHPNQYFPEIRGEAITKRWDGLLGGWMPAVRKVLPVSEKSYVEVLVLGDVEAKDKFIVQTWHRTALVEGGRITKVVYGYSYPAYPPARQDPKPEEFFRALLIFAEYWDRQLRDFAPTVLPDNSWVDMSKHCMAKELMVRPGGVYPKYGAVDRDYYGSEYDGFQDIFTSAVATNLEWGRFEEARLIIDNYFSDFVDAKGMINMRGPETAQFGYTLSLLAKYYNYTRDAALIVKHRPKIAATAKIIADMHDEALKRPKDDPGYGIIHGWSESDACLAANPALWWLPYYANNAFSARGLRDIARAWQAMGRAKGANDVEAQAWLKRAQVLQDSTVATMEKNVWRDRKPPYIGLYPGAKLMFRESMMKERPSPQQWAHRPYAELLHADVLPAPLANLVVDCMQAYGATTIGVLANVSPRNRAILGFISYGYAQALLRLDRVEQYLLFLYSHRYHDHTRGSWVAGEVSGINGGTALFCIPAQQTIPNMVRWMLVLEDSDEDRLYFAKGVPREWVGSGKPVSIQQAPTRWGRVNMNLVSNPSSKSVTATVEIAQAGTPREIQVKLRMPKAITLSRVTVNGRPATLGGPHSDVVTIATGKERRFEVVGQWG
jgi:hypothetical protein